MKLKKKEFLAIYALLALTVLLSTTNRLKIIFNFLFFFLNPDFANFISY